MGTISSNVVMLSFAPLSTAGFVGMKMYLKIFLRRSV
jgi:hypothetical protein